MEVDIWSDIACPWCYVGRSRLRSALAGFEGAGDVSVRWHSFELDPQAPAERAGDYAQALAHKYGTTRDEAAEMLGRMTGLAAAEGLEIDFERLRAANTFDAHRLVRLALEEGRQDEAKERLMRAYFAEGELLSDHGVLARLAREVGLEESAVREMLAGDAYAEDVRSDEYTASRLGIRGVPFFVIDRAFAIEGAQSPEYILEVLRRARAASEQPEG